MVYSGGKEGETVVNGQTGSETRHESGQMKKW